MKNILFVLLLLPSLAYSQEAWLDDSPVEEPAVIVDPMEARMNALESSLADIAASINALAKAPKPVAMPSTCECNCDCPTLEEIRGVVREEIERVTITVKSTSGVERKVEIPLTKTQPVVKELQVGEVVTAINGQPVTPFKYGQTSQGTVTQYATPSYEMRILQTPSGFFGAVRQSTCRMVNGVKVCN